MPTVLIAGIVIVNLALLSYAIGIISEQRSHRVSAATLNWLRLGVVLDVTATACMIAGSSRGWFTPHGVLGFSSLAAMVVENDQALRKQYRALVPHLEDLHELYRALRQARESRGAIDFETTETRIIFGKERKIDRIVPLERNDAHKMIEECMIAANVAAARFLIRQKMPTLFRVHAVGLVKEAMDVIGAIERA